MPVERRRRPAGLCVTEELPAASMEVTGKEGVRQQGEGSSVRMGGGGRPASGGTELRGEGRRPAEATVEGGGSGKRSSALGELAGGGARGSGGATADGALGLPRRWEAREAVGAELGAGHGRRRSGKGREEPPTAGQRGRRRSRERWRRSCRDEGKRGRSTPSRARACVCLP